MTMRFRSIVVSVEEPKMPHELREALKLVDDGGRIHILYTTDNPAVIDAELRALGSGASAIATPRPNNAELAVHVRSGGRPEEVLRLAVEADADLIVVGASKPEADVVVARIMSWAACSVLVLAPNREPTEAEGFVPLFPQCGACAAARRRDPTRWTCDQHAQDPTRRFEAL